MRRREERIGERLGAMDVKPLLERSGFAVTGEPPEITVAVVGESVPVMVQVGAGDLVECIVALGGATVGDDDAERVALEAPGDTTVEQVDELVRITRRLSLPTQSELYDALHEVAGCAVVLARTAGGSGATTFEKAVAAPEPEPPAPEPEPEPPAPEPEPEPPAPAPAPVAAAAAPAAAPDPDATVATPVLGGEEALFWFYVDTPQPIVSGDASRTVLATLQPGNWYRGLEEAGEWVRAADDNGTEGWLGANVVRRQ